MLNDTMSQKLREGIRKSARAMRRSIGSMTMEEAARAGHIVPLDGWNGLDLVELDELFDGLDQARALRVIWRARTEFGIDVTGPDHALEQIRHNRLGDQQRFQLVMIAQIEWAKMQAHPPCDRDGESLP